MAKSKGLRKNPDYEVLTRRLENFYDHLCAPSKKAIIQESKQNDQDPAEYFANHRIGMMGITPRTHKRIRLETVLLADMVQDNIEHGFDISYDLNRGILYPNY